MKIKSISDISVAVFYPLKKWAEESTGNFNMLIGIGFLLLIVSVVLMLVYTKKIGREDERTNKIFLNATVYILFGIVFCDIIFPKEYMWQIFFLFKYAISFLAAGIFLFWQYKKDFS